MIKIDKVIINGAEFIHTYSDAGVMIERDGVRYEDAYDPVDAIRTYTETNVQIMVDDATEADYIAALNEMGVDIQ